MIWKDISTCPEGEVLVKFTNGTVINASKKLTRTGEQYWVTLSGVRYIKKKPVWWCELPTHGEVDEDVRPILLLAAIIYNLFKR